MAENTVQGWNAILYFYKNSWEEFLCSKEISLTISADSVPTKTVGDGVWTNSSYQDISYTVNLSSIMKFANNNFTGWDMIENILGFTTVQWKATFTDDSGLNIQSFQGQAIINSTGLSWSPTDLLDGEFLMTGVGPLMFYSGTIACPSSITSIAISGQTGGSGTVGITYGFTGPVYQVKYRIDGVGSYSYALLAQPISIASLPVGTHVIEMIPICANGYLGVGTTQSFQVTYAMTCSLQVTSITVTGTGPTIQASVAFNADPSTASMRYSLNGGAFVNYTGGILTNPTVINLNLTTPGPYTIQVVPTCANGVDGISGSQSFTVTTSALISTINWSYNTDDNGTTLLIYKNGLLQASAALANTSGTFSAVPTDSINTILSTNFNPSRGPVSGNLTITDSTTSVVLTNQSYSVSSLNTFASVNFIFSPSSGNTYSISANG